jgi:hypothetical protein
MSEHMLHLCLIFVRKQWSEELKNWMKNVLEKFSPRLCDGLCYCFYHHHHHILCLFALRSNSKISPTMKHVKIHSKLLLFFFFFHFYLSLVVLHCPQQFIRQQETSRKSAKWFILARCFVAIIKHQVWICTWFYV